MNTIAKELAKQAKSKGICEDWHKELKALTDKRAMVDMYIRGIDFCLSNDYPSNDYIRANFKGVMEEKGVFLDDEINLVNFRYCVALGTTQGDVNISGYKVCEVFAKHQSSLNIIAKDDAFVMIDAFDNSRLSISACGNSNVCVNIYGKAIIDAQEKDNAHVKVVHKNKKTY